MIIHLMSGDGSMALCCHQPASQLPGDDLVTRTPARVTCSGKALRMSQRYACIYTGTPVGRGMEHDSGSGGPPRQKCRGCGGQYVSEFGRWGVFEHSPAGIYQLADAEEHYLHQHLAQRLADRENKAGAHYVVRWIPEAQFRHRRAA